MNGNGTDHHDPKWDHFVEVVVPELCANAGKKIAELNLAEKDETRGHEAMAKSLIYAGCTVLLSVNKRGDITNDKVHSIIDSFFADIVDLGIDPDEDDDDDDDDDDDEDDPVGSGPISMIGKLQRW